MQLRTPEFRKLFLSLALLTGLVVQSSKACLGNEWPEFRGPSQNGSSLAGNLPTEWNESSNVLWFSKTTGLGWSSPVVDKDRIYFTTSVNTDEQASQSGELQGKQQLNLVCLDAKTGEQIYSKVVFEQPDDAPKIHNKNSHASPTPILSRDRIYLHFGHQGTACTDLQGNLIWENRDHAYPPTHGNGGSPILVDQLLILTCDGGDDPYTLALNANTGKEVWKTKRGVDVDRKFSFCTPQLIEVQGKSWSFPPAPTWFRRSPRPMVRWNGLFATMAFRWCQDLCSMMALFMFVLAS